VRSTVRDTARGLHAERGGRQFQTLERCILTRVLLKAYARDADARGIADPRGR